MKVDALNELGPLRKLYVVCKPAGGLTLEGLRSDDREAVGRHEFVVPESLDDGMAAALAMGIFHSTVPIKFLDTVDCEVVTEHGGVLEPDDDMLWYDLAIEYENTLWKRPNWFD